MEVETLELFGHFIESMQRVLTIKKTKVTLYIASVLWIAVITQIAMNRVFFRNLGITEAFVKANTEDMECSLEVVARHKSDYLSETEKKDIIYHIANAIGLKISSDIDIVREEKRTEYAYHKQAKRAETELKLVSTHLEEDSTIKVEHYIIVRLRIRESIKSIDRYRRLIEKVLDDVGAKNRQVSVLYEGVIDGLMSWDARKDMAQFLIRELQGEEAFDWRQGESYTVYAYTGLIDEYIETVGCRINIQIAMTYDEAADKTRIYLATPVINQSW